MHQLGSLKLAIADSDSGTLSTERALLRKMGHDVVINATTVCSLMQESSIDSIDLVIVDISAVSDGDVQAVVELLQQLEVPLVVTSDSVSDEIIERAEACRPLAHLVKPIREQDLKVAVYLALDRFEELKKLRSEASSLRQALADRKIIERAKGVVMRQRGIDEAAAFKHIQHLARDQRVPLVAIANCINTAESAFLA